MGIRRARGPMAANIHGAITISAAISRILPTETPSSPGAIARSTMAIAESSPVGSFPLGASPFGMEDMAGNVWEWCRDYFEPYSRRRRLNPRGPTSGAKRVYRGGSWKSRFNSLRTTTRGANAPELSPATIWASGSSASANPEGSRS